VLYPFAETRQALYEGAKRAALGIPRCQPYQLTLSINVKKQHLVFGAEGAEPKVVIKGGLIEDPLRQLKF
jgi:D-amino peptidase